MKRAPFLPSPIALLSGVLLYALLIGFGAVTTVVLPRIFQLFETEPRLAMIALLGLVISPAFVVVIAHHIGHRSLDRFDQDGKKKRPSLLPKIKSVWAGALAWLVLYGTSFLASLVMLVINPPQRPDPDSWFSGLWSFFSSFGALVVSESSLANAVSLHSAIWIAIAVTFFELERRTRRKPTDKKVAD